jgi:hypothetical protein
MGISRILLARVISLSGVSSYLYSILEITIFIELTAMNRPGHACLGEKWSANEQYGQKMQMNMDVTLMLLAESKCDMIVANANSLLG